MPEEYQSIAAIGIVILTITALLIRVAWRRRKARKGASCAGGCGCKTTALPPHLASGEGGKFGTTHY